MKKKQKRQLKFSNSLDQYVVGRVSNVPWRWEWVGVGMVGVVAVVSIITGYITSPTLGADKTVIIRGAAQAGDYESARNLYEQENSDVLGASLELEEIVYPELKLAREIEKQEKLLIEYPGSRDVLLSLASLYDQLGNDEKSGEYLEMARVLNPNGLGR